MSTVCVQTSGGLHPIPNPNPTITSNTINPNINSYHNYGNEIAITTTLTGLQTLSTLNCSDIGIDVSSYGNNCHNQSIQTIKANPMSQLSSISVPSIASNPPFIQIPFGWKRELIDGRVVYYSPTNCCLQSIDQLSKYLESDGTCKCGLECPLHISRTFSFNPSVSSKPYDIEIAKSSNENKLCNHKRKIIALATYRHHSSRTQQLIAELNHKQTLSDIGCQLESDCNVDSNVQQRQHFQSGDNSSAQTIDCLTVSNVENKTSNSSQLNSRKDVNETIDGVSVIHSNENIIKSGQPLGLTQTVINRSLPQSYSNLMPQNMNGLHNRCERPAIIRPQQQYIQTSNCDNRCHYSVPIGGEPIAQTANSFCLYDNTGNSSVYSTHISVQPNDNKTSIYLTPQNAANYGQMISYENPNVNLIQPSHSQTFCSEAYSHAFHPSEAIPSYIPLSSSNSGTISFNASPLSTTSITLNPTYHSGLTSHDSPHCHSQNNISILPNPPMPPLSVPNVSTVTTSVTDVIPAVGVAPQIINTTNPSGAPQVLQFINSVPLTQITANTVTVLQQSPAQEVPVPGTTLIIPQLMPPHEHPMVINHTMTPQTAMFPHIATAAGLTALPNPFSNAISITNAIPLTQRTCIQEKGKTSNRTRRRKDYNRTNRSHPPTVASILKQAADNEKKQKELELNERQKQKDQELQTICENFETICETNSGSDQNECSYDLSPKESISVAVQSELPMDSENLMTDDCDGSQPTESSNSDNDCLTGDNSTEVLQEIKVQNNVNDENPISDSSSEQSSPSSEFCIGTGSDSGVESEPATTPLCTNLETVNSDQVVDTTRQRSLKRLKRLRKELSVYYGNDNSDDECPQSPPLPPQTRTFNTGDLVWGQKGDVRIWPGKLVSDDELIGLSIQREEGKLIVQWFGDHRLTQVDPINLKTLSEGLEEHHCARKRHRSGKRMNTCLEEAIQEAMMELDRQTNDTEDNSLSSSSSGVLATVSNSEAIDTID